MVFLKLRSIAFTTHFSINYEVPHAHELGVFVANGYCAALDAASTSISRLEYCEDYTGVRYVYFMSFLVEGLVVCSSDSGVKSG